MRTLTLRIDGATDRWLSAEAKRLSRTKSEIVRDALRRRRDGEKGRSLHDRIKDVCGTLRGPRDLSTNPTHLKSFGE